MSAFDSSTVQRLMDGNTTAISNIGVRPPLVTAITPHVPHANNLTIPFTTAGSPLYSQIIFTVHGEQSWQFVDHVRIVIIALHKLNSIINILQTCFRWDNAFELSSITAEGGPNKITPADIANDLYKTQYALYKACTLISQKEDFQIP